MTEAPMANAIDDVKVNLNDAINNMLDEHDLTQTLQDSLHEDISQLMWSAINSTSNYIADHAIYPKEIHFSNGRIVRLSDNGAHLIVSQASDGSYVAELASPAPSQHTGWSDEAVEALAISVFDQTSDNYTVPWDKQPGRVRSQTRKHVRQVLTALRIHQTSALTAASSIAPATGFEVKALEWDGDFARTEFGLFYHVDRATGVPGLVILEKIEGSCTTKSAWPDIPSAEAHAQADFDRRIRSSISPSVAKESGEP